MNLLVLASIKLDKALFCPIMGFMRKMVVLALLLGFDGFLSGQSIGASLGFQYGTAQVTENRETRRKVTEPGILLTLRFVPATVGAFGRLGMLFPSEVTEGDLTLSYSQYDYILFFNGAFGASFYVPINNRLSFFFDAGLSINDLCYGGSYKDTITASWNIKLGNMGGGYSGTTTYSNIPMKESYNDVAFGILGNAALRFNFTQRVFLELGVAASFDFLRLRTYKFAADFSAYPNTGGSAWQNNFPGGKYDDPADPHQLILDSNSKWGVFKQFTFIPSISVGMSL
jgi:hypothetical protein